MRDQRRHGHQQHARVLHEATSPHRHLPLTQITMALARPGSAYTAVAPGIIQVDHYFSARSCRHPKVPASAGHQSMMIPGATAVYGTSPGAANAMVILGEARCRCETRGLHAVLRVLLVRGGRAGRAFSGLMSDRCRRLLRPWFELSVGCSRAGPGSCVGQSTTRATRAPAGWACWVR